MSSSASRAALRLLVAALALVAPASALRLPPAPSGLSTRRAAVSAAAAAALLPGAAFAASKDGTKKDKKFEECLSQCVYTQTKITKGIGEVEVMSRKEAYGICKPQCATSKEQLLLGQPKK